MGERIRSLRQRRGWSLSQLALRAEVDRSYLSKLERDTYGNPGHDTLRRIGSALGVRVEDLTGESAPSPQLVVYSGVVWVPFVERTVHAGAETWREASGRTPLSEQVAKGHRRLFAAKVSGSCMEPFIVAGATVIWDPDRRDPADGEMVVVSHEGTLIVKWAYKHPGGGYVLRSNDGQELRPNGAILEGVVVKIENDPVRGPRVDWST